MKVNTRLVRRPVRGSYRPEVEEVAVVKRTKVPLSDTPLSVRVPLGIVKRLDALIRPIATDAAMQGVTGITRAAVTKRALLEGLAVLEARYK